MSLKAFHVLFVVISVALATGFGLWALSDRTDYFGWGIGSLIVAVGLVVYGVIFLLKLRREQL